MSLTNESAPHWDDVAGALRDLAPLMTEGMRPLAMQAADEIERLRVAHIESERQLRACQDQLGTALEPGETP